MQLYCAPHHMPSFHSTGCDRQEDSCTGKTACPRMAEALREQTAPDCSHPECPYGLRRRAAGRQAMQQQPQPACVAPAGLPAALAAAPLLHNCGSIQFSHITTTVIASTQHCHIEARRGLLILAALGRYPSPACEALPPHCMGAACQARTAFLGRMHQTPKRLCRPCKA